VYKTQLAIEEIFMEDGKILDAKIYELAINTKNHTEDRRDEINRYYTSLFAAIISIIPFIDKITNVEPSVIASYNVKIASTLLSFIGLTLSISWVLTLKRLYNFLEAMDKLLTMLESKYDKSFIIFISTYLSKIHSPDRVTKQVMLVPYTFVFIFTLILLYSLVYAYVSAS
jgi:hypothetical protein